MFKNRPTTAAIGQAAYEAYAEAVSNRSVNGDELPTWDALTAPVRNAWQLAAESVRHKVELSTT
ncbi:hypothetical protein HXS80_20560 [Streptomyces sp. CB04723]|uniref:hypothetical protein n=1 Tax=Streptomyces TaxID=1883 RepID=UPI0015C44BC0|nr:hypothetical protein [Streptomyces sp. CB04723]QLG33796.1 hypothetical protein HXS80_20560 [Streptomyces sp. CB04723]